VVELTAGVIANLVEGEILQMKEVYTPELCLVGASRVGKEVWNTYLMKTYLKTASLMAKSARAAVILGGCSEGQVWKEVAYAFGRNLGIAFQVCFHFVVFISGCRVLNKFTFMQLVDDVLDYESGEATLGKPGGADLRLGLATGPALYAWEEHAEMGPLIERKFEQEGDVDLVSGYAQSAVLTFRV
jgi:hexaprenyl-diphosphate synthase